MILLAVQKPSLATYSPHNVSPSDFTFVCPTEIRAFSDRYDEFKDLETEVCLAVKREGLRPQLATDPWATYKRQLNPMPSNFDDHAQVLGVSVDSHHTHLAWIKTNRKVSYESEHIHQGGA